jgi:hypothetical protein
MFQSLDTWVETAVDEMYDGAVLSDGFLDICDDDLVTMTGLARLVRCMTHSTKDIRPLVCSPKRGNKIALGDWLDSFKSFGAASKQGEVVSARLFKRRTVVLKSYSNLFETARRDFVVGLAMANSVRAQCPFFVFTFGAWRDDKGGCCVLTDLVNGTVLSDCLKKCSSVEFLNIFAQILFALETAQREFSFCHYDLHMRNVIVQRRTKPSVCSLGIYDYVFSYEKYPTIIDLGMSFMESREGEIVGPEHLEKFGIFKKLRVGYDAFTFLLFAYKEMEDRTIVKKLLTFFGTDLKLASHVECLEKFTDDKTPGMMLAWMLKEFPNTIAVERRDRERVNFQMPESWCASRLLKQKHAIEVAVVDPSVETSFIRYQMARHVNAHMGHFEKKDSKCGQRIRVDFETIQRPIADIESVALLLIFVKHLGLDRKSTTYAGWVRSLTASPEFRRFVKRQSIGERWPTSDVCVGNKNGESNLKKRKSVDVFTDD